MSLFKPFRNPAALPSPVLWMTEPLRAPLLILAASALILATAYAFQYAGYQPCILCLYQRIPYFAAIAFMGFVWALRPRAILSVGIFFLTGLVFYAGAAIAAYHVGVEYRWWPGPDVCAMPGQTANTVEELLKMVEAQKPVRCDEVQWRFLGLSMAAYNVIASLILADLAVLTGWRVWHGQQPKKN